jgi:regulator of RNase E activity RraA
MLDRLRALDSCAVSDALDTLNLPGATTGIGPLWAVREPVVGRVRTVLAGPRQSDRPAQHIAAAAIEAAEPGEVLCRGQQVPHDRVGRLTLRGQPARCSCS